jgi:hypothetical protein
VCLIHYNYSGINGIVTWSEGYNTTDISNMLSGSMAFAINTINSIRRELKNYDKIPFYTQTREFDNTLA